MAGGASVAVEGNAGPVVAVNVDTGAGTQSFRVPEAIAFTAFMINRVEQLRGVQRALKLRLESRKLGPLLIVLTGDVADFHEGFAQRYERLEARKRLDLVPGIAPLTPLRVLHWPRRRITLDELLLSFAGPIPTLMEGDDADDVLRELRDLPESISFRHILKAAHWDDRHEALVRNWFDFVERDWPKPKNPTIAIGFLCIQTDEAHSKQSKAMRQALGALRSRYADSERIYFASEFEPIERIDMEEWEPVASERLGRDFHAGVLLGICDRLFTATDQYRYGDLYGKLMTDIEKWYSAIARPQFKEK